MSEYVTPREFHDSAATRSPAVTAVKNSQADQTPRTSPTPWHGSPRSVGPPLSESEVCVVWYQRIAGE